MRYSLAIFDLDGTLVDSFPWFLRHVNDVADKFGFRRIAADEIEDLRRAGSREILSRFEVPLWKLPMIARHMRRLKSQHIGDFALFPGASEMLHALKDGGMTLALVSSDSEANARRQLGDANAALFSEFACGASLFGRRRSFGVFSNAWASIPPMQLRLAMRSATSKLPAPPASPVVP